MARLPISNINIPDIRGEQLERVKIPFFSKDNTATGAEAKIVILTKSIEQIRK